MTIVWIAIKIIAVLWIIMMVFNIVMGRKGYSIRGKIKVRCRKGHHFETRWIGNSLLKGIRLGPTTRYQLCPKCRHWAIIHPI